jgi:6-phosphogluconolactonase
MTATTDPTLLAAEPAPAALAWHIQPTLRALTEDLVARFAALARSADPARPVSIALPGGRTPRALLRALAHQRAISARAWSGITLVPTDERWVDIADAASNEGTIYRELIARLRAAGNAGPGLVSLKTNAATPALGSADVALRLNRVVPGAFDWVILGMGSDGHIASLFPGGPLQDLLQPAAPCLAARHPQTHEPRLSLSLARLLHTRAICLLVSGADKRRVLDDCLAKPERDPELDPKLDPELDSEPDLPIAALLRGIQRSGTPCEVFWTPDENLP